MKKITKNIYDELSVGEIPEGKEKDYYSEEESLKIKQRLKSVAKFQILLIAYLTILMIIHILKMFIEFPEWLKILIYIIVGSGIVIFIIAVIKYHRFLKFVKEISKD